MKAEFSSQEPEVRIENLESKTRNAKGMNPQSRTQNPRLTQSDAVNPMRFEKIEELTDGQISDLHRMFQEEWWTKGRELEDVRRMLEHTNVIVGFCDAESKRLVAFARVLTDYVYKALVLDVIVEAGSRGRGLARALMGAVVGHPTLVSVRHFELYCRPQLVPLYRKWGFSDELGDLRLMRRVAPGTGQPGVDQLAVDFGG